MVVPTLELADTVVSRGDLGVDDSFLGDYVLGFLVLEGVIEVNDYWAVYHYTVGRSALYRLEGLHVSELPVLLIIFAVEVKHLFVVVSELGVVCDCVHDALLDGRVQLGLYLLLAVVDRGVLL